MSNVDKHTLTKERAQEILKHVAAGEGGNIKRFATVAEHNYIMQIQKETGARYIGIIYEIAYPKEHILSKGDE